MSDDPPGYPRPKDCPQQARSEFRKKLTENMLKNLNKPAKEAQGKEEMDCYLPLSAEDRSEAQAVLRPF